MIRIVFIFVFSMQACGCSRLSISDQEAVTASVHTQQAEDFRDQIERTHVAVWQRFRKTDSNEEQLRLAYLICRYFVVSQKERGNLVRYLKRAETMKWEEHDFSLIATIALGYLDDSVAEGRVLSLYRQELVSKVNPPLGFPHFSIDLWSKYVEQRGGALHLVRRLRSDRKELREAAWDILSKFWGAPHEYEPEKAVAEQTEGIERLEKWAFSAKGPQ